MWRKVKLDNSLFKLQGVQSNSPHNHRMTECDGQNVVPWRREWKPPQYSCLENPMNSMKRQKDRTLKEELHRSVGAQYATGDQWRNSSRKNEGMEPKQKQRPVVDRNGLRCKVQCRKEQYCRGTWNVRSMTQGTFEVVKQEMARVNFELDYKESWAPKNWCFWTVVLEKTLESPLDCKKNQSILREISPGCSLEGLMLKLKFQYFGHLMWKAPDAGRDWGQEEKGRTEDEMVGWHHQLNGHEFE